MKRIIISALIMMFAVGSFASDNKKKDSQNDTSTTTTVSAESQEVVPTPAPLEEETVEYPSSSGDQGIEDMGTDSSSSDDDDW